jgi:hypothetical protein
MTIETEDDELRAESDQIIILLDEVRAMIAPPAWDKLERILQRVVSLYSHGLERALVHARNAGADDSFDLRISDDDLLASLLLLHGLHPLTTDERVRPALEVSPVDGDGTVQVRATGPLGGGAMSARLVEGTIRRAIEDAAPEIVRIELSGLPPPVPPPSDLVQIRRSRETGR